MADPPSLPEVVVEVVGWDGIDPLPELPLFHPTAEDSFGGSLYIFGEPALFWLEGWRAFMRFHRGDNEVPTQEAPVLARFRNFLVRYYGEDWEAMILSESGEVLLFELRAILAGWLGSWRSRGKRSLRRWRIGPKLSSGRGLSPWRKPGASCAWTERHLPAGLSYPVGLVVL